MYADLHLHSCFSDGTWTPEQMVEMALQHHLGAVALTDHDTVEGCERMSIACARHGIGFAPGVEMTTEWDGEELHLLGYFVDAAHPQLLSRLEKFQLARQERIREIVSRLNGIGIPIQQEAVFALANCRSPGRPHVARVLVQQGFCSSHDEAFGRFLKKHRPAWVPKWKVLAPDAIRLLHEAGGLAVMAHPGLTKLDHFIPFLVEAGIDGLECYHPKHSPAISAHYTALARHYSLLVTGGSDCHGMNKAKPMIGTVLLAYEHFERLADFAQTRCRETCRLSAGRCPAEGVATTGASDTGPLTR